MNFDPSVFMYLNPEICLSNRITTVEKARDYWSSNNVNSNWQTVIPSDFDASSYLLNNRLNVNFSGLNKVIRELSLLEGIELKGRIFSYINEYGTCEGSNTIRLDNSNVRLTSNLLSIGDVVALSIEDMTVCSRVTSIDSNIFVLDNRVSIPRTTRVKVTGTMIYDLERLARVNYVNGIGSSMLIDSNFNVDLYRLLYMDARDIISDNDVYNNYALYNGARIGSVLDLMNMSGGGGSGGNGGNIDIYEDLTVNNKLTLGGDFWWRGVRLEYITNDPLRRLGILSPYERGLATEYAMKQWTYNLFWPNSILSNVSLSNLQVKYVQGGETVFQNDVTFDKPVIMNSNLTVIDTVIAEKGHYRHSLYVNGNTQIDQTLYSCNINVKEIINSPVIGIGPVNYSEYPYNFLLPITSNNPVVSIDTVFSSDSNGGVLFQIDTINAENISTGNIAIDSLFIREDMNLSQDINTIGNLSGSDLILPMTSNIFDMLYETNSFLNLPQDNVTEKTIDITSTLESPTTCSTNGINIIQYNNAPKEANFILLSDGSLFKIVDITNSHIEVIGSNLPPQVIIEAFKLIDISSISTVKCLYELTTQINALTKKLFTNCRFLSIMHCGQ